MIVPTVGRVVWFHHGQESAYKEALAAHVAAVNDDGTVNLMVISQRGEPFPMCGVPLIQDDDKAPATAYAEWVPFQKQSAAKVGPTVSAGPAQESKAAEGTKAAGATASAPNLAQPAAAATAGAQPSAAAAPAPPAPTAPAEPPAPAAAPASAGPSTAPAAPAAPAESTKPAG